MPDMFERQYSLSQVKAFAFRNKKRAKKAKKGPKRWARFTKEKLVELYHQKSAELVTAYETPESSARKSLIRRLRNQIEYLALLLEEIYGLEMIFTTGFRPKDFDGGKGGPGGSSSGSSSSAIAV